MENKPKILDTVTQRFDVFTKTEVQELLDLKKEINSGDLNKDLIITKKAPKTELEQKIEDIIWTRVQPILKDYYKSFLAPLRDFDLHHLGMAHDNVGSFTELHYESGYIEVAGVEHVVRPSLVLIYLNDDYEGGDLHFPLYDFTTVPKAGSIVMFQSGYTGCHVSMPVMKGSKYICRLTIESPTYQHKTDAFHL